jgi:hypothetical protein
VPPAAAGAGDDRQVITAAAGLGSPRTPDVVVVHEREHVHGVAKWQVDDEVRKPPNGMSAPHVRDGAEDRMAKRSLCKLQRRSQGARSVAPRRISSPRLREMPDRLEAS